MPEVYCAPGLGPNFRYGETQHCSRCHQPVVAGPHPDATLLCTDCLHDLSPVEASLPADWHPDHNPMHCSDCFFQHRF